MKALKKMSDTELRQELQEAEWELKLRDSGAVLFGGVWATREEMQARIDAAWVEINERV